jgi:hypothetical protein
LAAFFVDILTNNVGIRFGLTIWPHHLILDGFLEFIAKIEAFATRASSPTEKNIYLLSLFLLYDDLSQSIKAPPDFLHSIAGQSQ